MTCHTHFGVESLQSQPSPVETTSPYTQGIHISKPQSRLLHILAGIFSALVIGSALLISASGAQEENNLRSALTIIAPAAAGGGWDTVARQMQQAQRAQGITNNTQVLNIPGAGGTIALENLNMLAGKANNLIVGGTGQLAATIQYDTATSYRDVTALAITVEEYDVIVVPADSPYHNLKELMQDWSKNPSALVWTGGGSFDRLVASNLAVSANLSPQDMVYVNSDGGGEATQALLNGTADVSASGYGDTIDQIQAGKLRPLALVAQNPIPGVDIPTTVEQGYQVTLANWRILLAPGGISQQEKEELESSITETVATAEWKKAVQNYHWNENLIMGQELEKFLDQETATIRNLYQEMGL